MHRSVALILVLLCEQPLVHAQSFQPEDLLRLRAVAGTNNFSVTDSVTTLSGGLLPWQVLAANPFGLGGTSATQLAECDLVNDAIEWRNSSQLLWIPTIPGVTCRGTAELEFETIADVVLGYDLTAYVTQLGPPPPTATITVSLTIRRKVGLSNFANYYVTGYVPFDPQNIAALSSLSVPLEAHAALPTRWLIYTHLSIQASTTDPEDFVGSVVGLEAERKFSLTPVASLPAAVMKAFSYGTGTMGGIGLAPELRLTPSTTDTLSVSLTDADGPTTAFVALGTSPAAAPLSPWSTLFVDAPRFIGPFPVPQSGTVSVSEPYDPALLSLPLDAYLQAFVIDGSALDGFVHTSGLHVTIE